MLLLILTASCSSIKNLAESETALTKNVYLFETEDKRVKIGKLKAELKGLTKQSPVKKGVLNPRTWKTPLTIYDEQLTEASALSMQNHLRRSKGFYHAAVDFRKREKGRKIEVTYDIDLGPRYYVKNITMEGGDPLLIQLFESSNDQRIIEVGDPLDAQIFDEEEARLIDIAKNNGYADFNANFIEFRGDSSSVEVPVIIYVYNPLQDSSHQKYTLGEINVYTDHVATPNPEHNTSDTIDRKNFFSEEQEFVVKPKSIEQVISLKKGDLYSRENEFLTNKTLTKLAPYRFVTIQTEQDSLVDSIYNYNIFLTPHQHKWAFDMGANLFYSLLNQAPSVSQRDLLGVGGNLGWENRNFRNSAVTHRFGLEGTFEFRIPTFSANTLSIQANNSFNIPRAVEPIKYSRLFNKIGLLTDKSYDNLDLYTNTSVDFSLGITDILNTYSLKTLNATWSYTFQPDDQNRYIYTPIGINVLDTKIDSTFRENFLVNNPLIELSFNDYLFTGFIFKELNIFKRTKENAGGAYFAFLGNAELSGLEYTALNLFFKEPWRIGGLNFSQFLRLEADLRYYKKVTERSTLATRFNIGAAFTYGDSPVVPFVKSFFVGGPNSLRGWQLRELGPGTYISTLDPALEGQPFFESGDFKLEFNLEYRFDLFWFWEGALFFDTGNVWTFKERRPGSQLTSQFLDQMAMSAGWGLRFDFDYFLLRLDFGYKLRSPFPDPETNSHIVLTNGRYNGFLGNVNFAINYPF